MICAVPSLAAGSVLTYLNSQASLPCVMGPNKVAGVAERLVRDVSAAHRNAMLHESSSKVHEL